MSSATVIATIAKNSNETVRIPLDEWRGCPLIDVRIVVPLNRETGVLVPTKKGVSLKVERLPELIAALNDALVEARRLGLIESEVNAAA
jgi:hypothetical protein